MRIALSTHLLAYHVFQPHFADWIREAGFSSIEMWCMNPHFAYRERSLAEALRKKFDQTGIQVNAVHLPFYLHLDLLRQGKTLSPLHPDPQARALALAEARFAMDAAVVLGARLAVLHLGESREEFTLQSQERALYAIEQIGDYAHEKGLVIALENIISKLTDIENLRTLIAGSGLHHVGICVDVGHSHVSKDVIQDVLLAGALLRNTHLHDNDKSADQHRPPGQGSIPWRELAQAFDKVGYQGSHSLEIRDESRGGEPPESLLTRTVNRLRPEIATWGVQVTW